MGDLRNHIHGTYETMLLATIAIAGIPPFAGFWSKDEILGQSKVADQCAVVVDGAVCGVY